VQVDPIKPSLKVPGSILLKLRCGGPLSNPAFNYNLRRYTKGKKVAEGIYAMVGRCRLTLSKPS
jgi:hypothetical protein